MLNKYFIVIILSILFIIPVKSQEHINFYHISPKIDNGYRVIKNIVQDNAGYIWMAKEDGILKYDGYDFWFYPVETIFKTKDAIEKIAIDGRGAILILSKNGLLSKREANGSYKILNDSIFYNKIRINRLYTKGNDMWFADFKGIIYRKQIGKIFADSITIIPKNKNNNEITDIKTTEKNELYISTNKAKLYKYYNDTLIEIKGSFKKFPGIIYLTIGKSDDIWLGTEYAGIFCFDSKNQKFTQLSYYIDNVDILTKDMILSLFCDNDGIIWAGSDGEGLYRIDPTNNVINIYRHSLFDKSSLSSNSIISINSDTNNNLWVISNFGDINILLNRKNNIFHHNGSINNISARILSALKDSNNNLWLGTDGNGLTKVNLKTGKEKQFLNFRNTFEGSYIQTIAEDNKGNIWIGTYKKGLWYYNEKTKKISKIKITDINGIEATDVLTVFNDSKGRIWVGSDVELSIFNTQKMKTASFRFGEKGLVGELIRCIIEDSERNIWLGVDGGGLFQFNDINNNDNTNFQMHSFLMQNSESDYFSISAMTADTKNGIWIVTNDGKLCYLNTQDYHFTSYDEFEPFSDISFHAILRENDNSLWLSSNHGLWNFHVNDSSLTTFYKTDGFYNDYYIQRSAFKDEKSGFLYFGGLNGLDGFNPKKIKKVPIISAIHINSLTILNKTASEILPEQIKNGLDNTNKITLKSDQASFSFRFSAMGNVFKANYYYAYRLKGFNDEWTITQKYRKATYTNIPPGKYTFEVKAGTIKGVWDIPKKQIQVVIKPPFWRHPIAYIIYFLLTIIIIYVAYRWILLKKDLMYQKIKNDHETKNHKEKMIFFSKMSHEIQTPLTLILGPIEEMLKTFKDNDCVKSQYRNLKVVLNNARRLSKIAMALTTIKDKETGLLKLNVSQQDLIKMMTEISESFSQQAKLKDIHFKQRYFKESLLTWFDNEIIEHIIYNLLSNAFKYISPKGTITLAVDENKIKERIIITVEDTGFGISQKDKEDIFKLFYRAEKTKHIKGKGIGLALVKDLVDLHKGEITVSSKINHGTKFTISIPSNKSAYSKDEIITAKITNNIPENSDVPSSLYTDEHILKKKTLLIVEDNIEMLSFLYDSFVKYYNIIKAYNGVEGLNIAKEHRPNLIISDISMPIMDGLRMCEELQKDKSTSHIPVILLTAMHARFSKLKGLKSGAIEFIRKPFNIEELHIKVRNILLLREKAYSDFMLQYLSTPNQTDSKPKDLIFLENLINVLNQELDNPDFKLESLSEFLNMSYSAIYKKCQTLTGETLVGLFRSLRLKKAAILICKENYSISEACFTVGFNDPKYFTKTFKFHFKLTPTEFKKKAEGSNLEDFLKTHKLSSQSS